MTPSYEGLKSLISCVGSEHCSEHCLFRTSVPNTVSEPPPGPPEPQKDHQNHPSGGSGGLGGGSGGPGGCSETVFGTDVRNRCSEQTMFGTVFRANTDYKSLIGVLS